MNKIVLRNSLISVILIVALFVVLIIRDRSPYGKNQSDFASVPGKGITRIELSENGNKVTLMKEDGGWSVNGAHETRKSEVIYLIRILIEMKIKSPVTPEMFSKVIAEKNISPVKVRVYEENKLLKAFLVYKTSSNPYGNIMRMRERSRPFIVYVPGYNDNIGSAFIATELYWEPFTVFNLLPSEISSVTLENYSDTASSFKITRYDNKYVLSGIRFDLTGWDSSKVRRYISYFTRVPFENWADNMTDSLKNKIISQDPLYRITVKKTDGGDIILTMWERFNTETGEKDSDRLFGKRADRDELFIIRYFDIDPLLKKRAYFYVE
jgi:hypothetical protein